MNYFLSRDLPEHSFCPGPYPLGPGGLQYRIEGRTVILTVADPRQVRTDREAVLRAIARDPALLDGSVLLIDARGSSQLFDRHALERSIRTIVQKLGRRFLPLCGLIMSPGRELEACQFQSIAARFGLRVRWFDDEAAARRWLAGHRPMAFPDQTGRLKPAPTRHAGSDPSANGRRGRLTAGRLVRTLVASRTGFGLRALGFGLLAPELRDSPRATPTFCLQKPEVLSPEPERCEVA